MRLLITAAALSVVVLPLAAQKPTASPIITTVKIWSKGIPPEGPKQKDDYGDHQVSVSHRDKNGVVELHETKDDVMIVQSGAGTLVYGGKGVGMHPSAPHEQQGDHIEGGTSVKVGVGDVITIPVGTPHQFFVPAGTEITYLLIKVDKH